MQAVKKKFFWQTLAKDDFITLSLFLFSVVCLLYAQRHAESNLWAAWQTEEYSHGILIPFIALILAWHRLVEFRPVLKPSFWGLLYLLIAGCLQFVAQLAAFDTAAEYGLVLAVGGLSIAFLGQRATYVILPALIYLLFAIPLPHLIQADLSEDLQLISSTLGVMPLDLIGIPVFQEGNVIDLGGYRLQVVEACNGLRYLFPLMSFGYLAAFLLKDRWWKRIVLFLSTIPITIGMNALRIAFIGITVDLWGTHMAEGLIHSFEGWTVFLACIAILMGEMWAFLKIGKGGHFRYDYLGPARGPLFQSSKHMAPRIAATVGTVILALLFGTKLVEPPPEIIPTHPPLSSLQLSVDDWQGHAENLPTDVLQALKLSDYWIADYKRPTDASAINFYIAYYDSQRIGVTTHSPSNCIPGGGWAITDRRVETLTLTDGTPLKFTRLLIQRGDDTQIIYYWFDERGRDLTETYSAKWYLLLDSLRMHRSDGALIRLAAPVAKGESTNGAEKRLNAFLNAIYPDIQTHIPGAILVRRVATP